MMYGFDSISEFFKVLNNADIHYLVLRNYENLLEPEMFVDGHGDIDLLCDDYKKIVKATGAIPFHANPSKPDGDGIHYKIFVNGHSVSLDLRQISDGYYCEKWERELLNRRIKHECFFVMNQHDYFYTLIYHAILQKRFFSDEYRKRLLLMSNSIGVSQNIGSEREFIKLLEYFMKENGYSFTYSTDYMVPNRFSLVDATLIERNNRLKFKHALFDFKVRSIDLLVKLKHTLFH